MPEIPGFPARLKPGLRIAALLGLILSTLGLLITLRLPVRLWQALATYFSWRFDSPALQPTPFDDLKSPAPVFPLLMLLLWLVSALVLIYLARLGPVEEAVPKILDSDAATLRNSWPYPGRGQLITVLSSIFLLLLILGLGWGQRSTQLLPDSTGRFPQPNFDEMVYYQTSASLAAGRWPYRDFFVAHPPVFFLAFASILKLLGLQAGGVSAFLAGRLFALGQGLVTAGLVFGVAGKLWATKSRGFALGAALLAGLVYTLDGRAAEIAALENLSNLFAIAAFACFLQAEVSPKRVWWVAVGGLAALAALTKLPGLALLFALLVYLVFRRDWRNLGWLALGFGVVAFLVEAPFLIVAGPGPVFRQQVIFQVLRPQEVRAGIDQLGRIAAYPEASLTVFLGGPGLACLTWKVVRQPGPATLRLLIPVLWSFPLFFIFIFSKSFHTWYFVQWALPLSLLAPAILDFGLGLFKPHPSPRVASAPLGATRNLFVFCLVPFVVCLLSFPFAWQEWQSEHQVDYDRVYGPAADYIKGQPTAVPIMFALDPGYSLMSGLAPAQASNGKYLVDGSSYILYLNLDIDRSSLSKLVGQALGFGRDQAKIEDVFARQRGQAIVTTAVTPGGWAALDGKIALPQLTPRSVEYVATPSEPGKPVDYVTLYRVRSLAALRQWRFDNGLLLKPFGLSTSLEGRANYDQPNPDGSITLSAKEAATRTLDLRFVWQVTTPPAQQLKVFVHLIDERGTKVAQRDIPPLGPDTDTRQWQPGDAFQDVHALPLPANLPPGRYRVITGLYDSETNQRVMVEGQDSLLLGYLEIKN